MITCHYCCRQKEEPFLRLGHPVEGKACGEGGAGAYAKLSTGRRTEHGAVQRPIRLLSLPSSLCYIENFFVLSMYYAGVTTRAKE